MSGWIQVAGPAGSAAIALSLLMLSTAADAACSASDRPGTPDQVTMRATSPTEIEISWRNTTSSGVNLLYPSRRGTLPHSMWFDIYLRDAANRNVGKDQTGGAAQSSAVYHQRSSFKFTGLQSGQKYCASMRARTAAGTEGCISEIASNIACATTMVTAPQPAPVTPPSTPVPPPAPATRQCGIVAVLDINQCTNLDGSKSDYFTSGQTEGCGATEAEAERTAKAAFNGTLGDDPGECQYTARFERRACACPPPGANLRVRSAGALGRISAFAKNDRGAWGYAFHQRDFAEASRLALAGCGGAAGCRIFASTDLACAAFADSRTGGYWSAAGGGPTVEAANANVLRICQSGTAPPGTCVVRAAECR